jgi:signal peptidase I
MKQVSKYQLKTALFFLSDSIINKYVFRYNYYFVAGDWVLDSYDSRYWGLLPEDHIVGKVSFIWNSKDITTRKTRWKRIFKKL